MNSKEKEKITLRGLMSKRWFMIVLSVVLAVATWAIVSFSVSPDFTRTVDNVPLTISSTSFKNYGLDITEGEDTEVTVTVEGARGVVGSLTAADLVVVPNTSSVTGAGKYSLQLSVTKADPLQEYTIVSVSPASIEMSFEVLATKKVTVSTDIENLWAQDGYIIGTVSTTPGEITITGPKLSVDTVSTAVVRASVSGSLSTSETVPGDIVLLDEHGNEVPQDDLTIDFTTVEISIPVLRKALVPLEVGFINVQDGFKIETLDYVMSVDSINIAASESALARISSVNVGYIDLSTFQIGNSYIFDIVLPSGVINIDNTTQVTVSFQRNDLTTKRLTVTDMRFENAPESYDLQFVTKSVTVTLLGPEEVLNEIQSGSVVAVVDCDKLSLGTGEYDAELQFRIPGYDSAFVVGSYTALIRADVG